MPKLIFEDENGNHHNLAIKNIPSKTLTKNNVLLVEFEIGDASQQSASICLTQLKTLLKKTLPEDIKFLVVATRNGKGINIKAISTKEAKKIREDKHV